MTSTPPSCFARVGSDAPRFGDVAVRLLEEMNFPPGTGINDPINAPDGTLQVDGVRVAGPIMDVIHASGEPDAFVMHITVPVFTLSYDQVADHAARIAESSPEVPVRRASRAHFLLVPRSDGFLRVEERGIADRRKVRAIDVPVFDEPPGAAGALAAMRHHARLPRKRR